MTSGSASLKALVWGCVVALALAVSVPHSHDSSSAPHQTHACRACKLQEQFAAGAGQPAAIVVGPRSALVSPVEPIQPLRAVSRAKFASPRSPPQYA